MKIVTATVEIEMTPFEKIEAFKNKSITTFGERLEGLVLTGSYARGDQTPKSDIDLWVFIKNISLKDIQTIGKIVSEIGKPPEINPQCTSFAELEYSALRDQFDPTQLYIESVVLHGSLPGPSPEPSEIRKYASSVAAFGLMSARHYISVQESEESLSKGKLMKWVIQPLMWAYRCRVLALTSIYPRTIEELLNSLTSKEEKEIVQIYSQILSDEFSDPYMQTIEKIEGAAKMFIYDNK